jgi:FAD dependent oxidoreductase TIGR03364
MSQPLYDTAVVGAGIIGLATEYQLARRGKKVIVFERGAKAQGASVRNFGMLWPIGQPIGEMYGLALRSRAFWLNLLPKAGIWYEALGSLHLAYHTDEAQVLYEFAEMARLADIKSIIGVPAFEAGARYPNIKAAGLKGALYSPTEVCIDPREAVSKLPEYLKTALGVDFAFGCAAYDYEDGLLNTSDGAFAVNNVYICSGDDLLTMYPDRFEAMGLQKCKLQMLRTRPLEQSKRLGPMLAAGLTLRHYKSFQNCPSLAQVKARYAQTHPAYDQFGIHVMASQNGSGELTLGDSHEYDGDIEIFDKAEIDRLVLDYLDTFLNIEYQIASRWHGIYVKHPTRPYIVDRPEENVTIIAGVGGAGMTLSFGLADKVVAENEKEGI